MAKASKGGTGGVSPEKYWARPNPPSHQGDPNAAPIYFAVGEALSNWESLEGALCTLFVMVTGASESPRVNSALRRAYGAIGFNSGRRNAIALAAEVYFGPHWTAAKVELNRLLHHVEQASLRRDDIAHGYVCGFKTGDTDHGCFLIPPEYNARMTFAFMQPPRDTFSIARAKYRFTSANIKQYNARFHELSIKILNYLVKIKKDADGKFSDEFLQSFDRKA